MRPRIIDVDIDASSNVCVCICVCLGTTDAISRIIPREFEEVYIRVFTRHKAQQSYVQQIFTEWCNSQRAARSSLAPVLDETV